jgi:predicted dehydrogenase
MSSPLALITPAKSHPEVIVQAVSAWNRQKAEEFAKAHGIPEVRDTYEGMSQRNHICPHARGPAGPKPQS